MKKKLLLLLLLGSSSLIAQEIDLTPTQEISNLKSTVANQNQKLDAIITRVEILSTNFQEVNQKLVSQNKEINSLKLTNQRQLENLGELNLLNAQQERKIDSLNDRLTRNNENLIENSQVLKNRIEESTQSANNQIGILDNSLSKNQLAWFIAIPLLALLAASIFFFLSRRIKSSKTDVESEINLTRRSLKALEEESIKIDQKLIDMLDAQLKLEAGNNLATPSSNGKEHQLALKVADEIVRMQKNIMRMDPDTQGLKPLLKGLERIQNNFAANDYEMINLLQIEYEDGMNIDVINFMEDEELDPGKKIISKVIKPQVNYNGVLIQRAQVEVSQN